MSLERAQRRRAPVLGLGIALGLALAATIAGPVSAANNVVVRAYFGDCQFAGSNAGASKTVKVDWRDSDGNLKSKHSVTSTGGGTFVSKCELGEFVETGDVLKTTIGTAARSFTVPKLTLTANRQFDTVFGFYDPSPASLVVQAITYNGGFAPTTASVHTAVPSLCCPTAYQADTWDTAPNLKGWDEVYTEWSNARGDSVNSSTDCGRGFGFGCASPSSTLSVTRTM